MSKGKPRWSVKKKAVKKLLDQANARAKENSNSEIYDAVVKNLQKKFKEA
jgi:hypothetical protein